MTLGSYFIDTLVGLANLDDLYVIWSCGRSANKIVRNKIWQNRIFGQEKHVIWVLSLDIVQLLMSELNTAQQLS